MDTSKRSGITQSSPLKIPYKSLTERRISSVFTSGLTDVSELEELGSDGDGYCATMFFYLNFLLYIYIYIYIYMFVFSRISWHQIFSFPWENQRYSAQVKASWGLRALRCLLFGSYWPYECDAGGGGPQRPSDPGWVPPPALSSCSGGRIKRVSLTGLTPSHPLHQSEGSEVRSIGSPWPTVCNRA